MKTTRALTNEPKLSATQTWPPKPKQPLKPPERHSLDSSLIRKAHRLARRLHLERLDGGRANSLRDAVGQALVDGSEDGELARSDLGGLDILEVPGEVVHEVLAVRVVEDLGPERPGLLEVNCARIHWSANCQSQKRKR